MAANLNRHAVRIAVGGDKSEQGYLIFAEGVLVAVISYLKKRWTVSFRMEPPTRTGTSWSGISRSPQATRRPQLQLLRKGNAHGAS